METSTLSFNDNLSLNENPLIARIVAGAIVDKLTSPQKDDDEQLQQENAVLMTKVKNLATKRNFNTLKNKLTNKIKGQTAQKVKTVAKKQKVKPPKPPKPPKPKPKAKVEPKGKGKQIIKKSAQALAKGILSALGGK